MSGWDWVEEVSEWERVWNRLSCHRRDALSVNILQRGKAAKNFASIFKSDFTAHFYEREKKCRKKWFKGVSSFRSSLLLPLPLLGKPFLLLFLKGKFIEIIIFCYLENWFFLCCWKISLQGPSREFFSSCQNSHSSLMSSALCHEPWRRTQISIPRSRRSKKVSFERLLQSLY